MNKSRSLKIAFLIEPPFNYRDKAGVITGCDVEVARCVCERLEYREPEFVETEFADLLPGLARGAWQMTTGLFSTEARHAQALFSRPIWALPDGLLIRYSDVRRIKGYQSIADDHKLKLAVVRDQVQHQTAVQVGVRSDQISVFETYEDAAEAVLAGQVCAFASVSRAHEGYLERHPNAVLRTVCVPASEKPAAFGCFAFAKTDVELRDAVDEVLGTFVASDRHRQLMAGFGFSAAEVALLSP